MKLCTIISAWGDTIELLPFCIENHLAFSNGVIVVWSERSNRGITDVRMSEFVNGFKTPGVTFHQVEPETAQGSALNERRKRNAGIELARQHMFTHFIIADADEFYDPRQVEWEKTRFDRPIAGLVCGLKVYIKHPTLRTDDVTLLPFIHRMTPRIKCSENRYYPFAYDNGGARIDPTRRLNITNGVQWSGVTMHHMSYVRQDIDLKIDNSTANLAKYRGTIKEDLVNASPGYVSQLYHRPLEQCANQFNLPLWN